MTIQNINNADVRKAAQRVINILSGKKAPGARKNQTGYAVPKKTQEKRLKEALGEKININHANRPKK